MRRALVWTVFLCLLPTMLYAETKYVSEVREITLRTGPGADFKITAMIKTGTPLTLVEAQGDWAQVQLQNGQEGWVLGQFLQDKVPDSTTLANLQKNYAALSSEADTLRSKNQDLTQKLAAVTSERDKLQKASDTLSSNYETLKTESATYLALKKKFDITQKALAGQKEKADRLETELTNLYNDKRLKWVGLGAGILLVGIILGFITKPQRRRSALF